MNNIILRTSKSHRILPILKKYYRDDWQLKEVRMEYNPTEGLPKTYSYEDFPCKILFDQGGESVEVRIFSLTVGQICDSSHAFANLLDFLGVKYNKEDIYTKKRMESDGCIRLKY